MAKKGGKQVLTRTTSAPEVGPDRSELENWLSARITALLMERGFASGKKAAATCEKRAGEILDFCWEEFQRNRETLGGEQAIIKLYESGDEFGPEFRNEVVSALPDLIAETDLAMKTCSPGALRLARSDRDEFFNLLTGDFSDQDLETWIEAYDDYLEEEKNVAEVASGIRSQEGEVTRPRAGRGGKKDIDQFKERQSKADEIEMSLAGETDNAAAIIIRAKVLLAADDPNGWWKVHEESSAAALLTKWPDFAKESASLAAQATQKMEALTKTLDQRMVKVKTALTPGKREVNLMEDSGTIMRRLEGTNLPVLIRDLEFAEKYDPSKALTYKTYQFVARTLGGFNSALSEASTGIAKMEMDKIKYFYRVNPDPELNELFLIRNNEAIKEAERLYIETLESLEADIDREVTINKQQVNQFIDEGREMAVITMSETLLAAIDSFAAKHKDYCSNGGKKYELRRAFNESEMAERPLLAAIVRRTVAFRYARLNLREDAPVTPDILATEIASEFEAYAQALAQMYRHRRNLDSGAVGELTEEDVLNAQAIATKLYRHSFASLLGETDFERPPFFKELMGNPDARYTLEKVIEETERRFQNNPFLMAMNNRFIFGFIDRDIKDLDCSVAGEFDETTVYRMPDGRHLSHYEGFGESPLFATFKERMQRVRTGIHQFDDRRLKHNNFTLYAMAINCINGLILGSDDQGLEDILKDDLICSTIGRKILDFARQRIQDIKKRKAHLAELDRRASEV